MKRLSYITTLLCVVALAGCTNDDFTESAVVAPQTEGVTLTATVGSETDTRTKVEELQVKWTQGDKFYAFGGTKNSTTGYPNKGTFTLNGTGGDKSGTFTGTLVGSQSSLQYGIYTQDVDKNFDPVEGKLIFPTEYTYPYSNAPMFGTYDSSSKTMKFTQLLCGMVRVKLSGMTEGSKGTLVLTASGIVGTATLTDIGTDGKVTVGAISGGQTTDAVTLKFDTEEGEMLLDVPVPAGEYSSGIQVVLTIDGEEKAKFTAVDENNAKFTVKAGEIRTMQELTNDAEMTGDAFEFTTTVSDVTTLNNALKTSSATKYAVATVNANDQIEVPYEKEADITLETVSGDFTVTGVAKTEQAAARNATAEQAAKVILRAPASNSHKVTFKKIYEAEVTGTFGTVEVSENCSNLTVKADAVVTTVSVAAEATNVESIVVEESTTEGASAPTITVDSGATVADLTTPVSTAEELATALAAAGKASIKLTADITISTSPVITGEKTIDLNTKTVTMGESITFFVEASEASDQGNVLTLKNGKITGPFSSLVAAVEKNAILNLESVVVTPSDTNGMQWGIYVNAGDPEGSGSGTTVNIKNCDITVYGQAVCTNANEASKNPDNYPEVTINVDNSKLTAGTGLLVNVPSNVQITNGSVLTGNLQGLVVRGGTVTCKNSFIYKDTSTHPNYTTSEENTLTSGTWKSGNIISFAAITLGNKDVDAYDFPTELTLEGCEVKVKDDSGKPSVYASTKDRNTVTLTYDSSTTFSPALNVVTTTGITVKGPDTTSEQ